MTPQPVTFTAALDPLLRDAPITHVIELSVLGIATRFETNSQFVLDSVEESFGGWRGLEAEAVVGAPSRVRVRLIVYSDGASATTSTPKTAVRHICPDATRLLVQSSQAIGVSDPERREAVAYVDADLVADAESFRPAILESLTWSLLTHFDRHPVHAAAIASAGRVLLLAAASGTGKSTISYVAHRAGMELLSDDRVWIQLTPMLRVWSATRPLRLLPEAVTDFPELASQPVLEVDGRRKISVAQTGCIGAYDAKSVVACVMDRGGETPRLERLAPDALVEALVAQCAPGFDRYPERQRRVMSALAERGGWRLTLGRSPTEALPLLSRMLHD